jgi:hypothetical protein
LRVILAFEDSELTDREKQMILLQNLYTEQPRNLSEAFRLGIRFLNGGKDGEEEKKEMSPRLYSFSQDADYIFAAFRQTHGIDLEKANLHWWKFLALFMDLGADTTFCNLVSLRKRIKTGKASKDELKTYHDLKSLIDLPEPDLRTLQERQQEAEFLHLVEEAEKRRAEEKNTAS